MNEMVKVEPIAEESLFLFARNKQELRQANTRLVVWLHKKAESVDLNAKELEEAVAHAKMRKWAVKPLQSQLSLVRRQAAYYEKLARAVDAGYTLIPMPWRMDTFAIRVKRKEATKKVFSSASSWGGPGIPQQKTDSPPAGEGRYVSEESQGSTWDEKEKDKDGKEITRYYSESEDFAAVAFPVVAAKPQLMSATAEAMALNIFDELGVAPSTRSRDPLLIGVVRGPNFRQQSFLIAWYLDVRSL